MTVDTLTLIVGERQLAEPVLHVSGSLLVVKIGPIGLQEPHHTTLRVVLTTLQVVLGHFVHVLVGLDDLLELLHERAETLLDLTSQILA